MGNASPPGAPTVPDLGFAETLADTDASPKRLPDAGDRINQYELIRELGRGGMGVVYLARDTRLARRVAVKLLPSRDAALNQRFILEARATARCSHESIVVIHEVNEHQGTPFMVLEHLDGKPLGRILTGQPMTPQRAIELMIPVARALACAHAHDIVHRDLKPDNVFVTDAGTIKVLDFGIAKLLPPGAALRAASPRVGAGTPGAHTEEAAGAPAGERPLSTTRAGVLMGTLPYMSPEQWLGMDVDHRSDLWSAGIILYEMLAGRHPLGAGDLDTLATIRDLDRPMPRMHDSGVAVPDALAAVVDRCLRKRREERIDSAGALVEALEALRPTRRSHARAQGENPYLGLQSFQASDADRYFGRAREIDEVLARLRNQPLMGVAGPTGIGKSSFVRAGLIAALERSAETWEAAVVRPGRDPIAALAATVASWVQPVTGEMPALAAPDADDEPDPHAAHRGLAGRLRAEPGYLGALLRHRARSHGARILLVIDPFEELYTLTPDIDTRLAFTACLAGVADDASAPVRVVVSIRSDFLDRVAEDRHFIGELTSGLVFLSAPDRRGLDEALTRPAEVAGYGFERRQMVDEILDAVETTPGSLPLLQFVAAKLWERRDAERRLLTEQSYRDLGGIFGALASHADAVVSTAAQLSPRALDSMRTLLQRLVTAERTRAIASLDELRGMFGDEAEVDRVIRVLVEARLLIVQSGDGAEGATVEIVHDSLIHSWPRLRRWLDDSEEDQVFLEQLRAVAKRWDATDRPQGLLWRDEAVREARRWRRRYRGTLAPLERDYLDATFALADRATRFRRAGIIGTMALLAGMVVAAAVALLLIREAEQQARDKAAAEIVLRTELQQRLRDLQEERLAHRRTTAELEEVLDRLQMSENDRQWVRTLLEQHRRALVEARQAALADPGQELGRELGQVSGEGFDDGHGQSSGHVFDQVSGQGLGQPDDPLHGQMQSPAQPGGADEHGPGQAGEGQPGPPAGAHAPPAQGADALPAQGQARRASGAPAEGSAGAAPAGAPGRARVQRELALTEQALEQARRERDRIARELTRAAGAGPAAEQRATEDIERAMSELERARRRLLEQLDHARARDPAPARGPGAEQ